MTHHSTEVFVDINLDNDLIPCIMKPTRIMKGSAPLIMCLYQPVSQTGLPPPLLQMI